MDVARPGLARDRGGNDLRQLARVRDPLAGPRAVDGARDRTGESLLAERLEDPRQRLLVPLVETLAQGPSPRRIHPHVERSTRAEGEAARGIVELGRGDAQIDERTVHLGDTELIEQRAGIAEVAVRHDDVAPR